MEILRNIFHIKEIALLCKLLHVEGKTGEDERKIALIDSLRKRIVMRNLIKHVWYRWRKDGNQNKTRRYSLSRKCKKRKQAGFALKPDKALVFRFCYFNWSIMNNINNQMQVCLYMTSFYLHFPFRAKKLDYHNLANGYIWNAIAAL